MFHYRANFGANFLFAHSAMIHQQSVVAVSLNSSTYRNWNEIMKN